MDWFMQAWSQVDFNPHLTQAHSLESIGKMLGIDLLLSLDNALVIALVARGLPLDKQRKGIMLGTLAAVLLRVIFALVAVVALNIWFIRALGGLYLVWVSLNLLFDESEEENHVKAATTLLAAMITIGLADLGMSMDNVLALAALASGNVAFIWIGVLISIPIVMFGAELARLVVNKLPILVWIGAVFLGFVAGNLFSEDPALPYYMDKFGLITVEPLLHYIGYFFGLLVLGGGLVSKFGGRKSEADVTG